MIPKISGQNLQAIDLHGAAKTLCCSQWKGVTGASVVGDGQIVFTSGDGKTRLWNVKQGRVSMVGGG